MTIQRNNNHNKHIAKNTMYLYIRMVLVMLVQLYTSRVILRVLGIEDYGIYNIVGIIVVSFSFVTGPLSIVTQRFFSFELGRNNISKIKDVFSMSLIVHIILSIFILILSETIGLWFLNNKMDIPIDRLYAANWVYQCSIFTFILNILNTPFNSAIIAYEKMSFYAYLSIFEIISKLFIVYLLLLISTDRLILYSLLIVFVTLIITTIYKIYCNRYLKNIKFIFVCDKILLKQLMNFSGWSLFGAIASMSANQGLNLLLNIFCGVTVNAAMGISNQVSSSINQFVTNFQTAFRPQIVKSYAGGEIDCLHKLICQSSKFSFLLLFMIICPLMFNLDFILHLWLGNNVPEYTSQFCRFMLLYTLIESLSAPIWMTVQATGMIRKYQLCISSLFLLNIIISYLFLKYGFKPTVVLNIKCFMALLYLMYRLFYIHTCINLSVFIFLKKTILPVFLTAGLAFLTMLSLVYYIQTDTIGGGILSLAIFLFIYMIIIYMIALTSKEKYVLKKIIVNKLCKMDY